MSKIWEETECALSPHRRTNEEILLIESAETAMSTIWETKSGWKDRNIPADRPSKKLDDKCCGPFKVIKKAWRAAYKLRSLAVPGDAIPGPFSTKYAPLLLIFLPFFLSAEKYSPDSLCDIIDDYKEYKVEEIMNSQLKQGCFAIPRQMALMARAAITGLVTTQESHPR